MDPVAYDFYLRGLNHLERMNKSDSEAAVKALEDAVRLDPDFADGFGALARAYTLLAGSFAPEREDELEPKAHNAISRAFALDPASGDAYMAQAVLMWKAKSGWRAEEAAIAYCNALTLKPTLDSARRALAVLYNHLGLTEHALRELAHTDESPANLFQRGLSLRINGQLDQALAVWNAIPSEARNTTQLGHIAWLLVDLGKSTEAMALLGPPPRRAEDVSGMLAAARAMVHVRVGDNSTARKWIDAATAGRGYRARIAP